MAAMERTATRGIYKRGNRYVIVWQHRGRQHKESFRTLAEAREAKGRRASGDRRKAPRVRFEDYAERWIATYRGRTQRGCSEETRADYAHELEHRVLPYFRGWWLGDVQAQDVKDWLTWLEDRGASASMIRKAKATLSALMGDANEEGKLRHNPARGVRWKPREPLPAKPKPRGLTVAELERFLAAVEPKWRLLFVLLAHTGLRIGEALGLRWEHVHLGDDPHLDVREQFYRSRRRLRPKSHHGVRTLPLSPGMAVALDRRLSD
jgi:integrase